MNAQIKKIVLAVRFYNRGLFYQQKNIEGRYIEWMDVKSLIDDIYKLNKYIVPKQIIINKAE